MIKVKFKFQDGTIKTYEGFGRIHGLRHNGERPISVLISYCGFGIPQEDKEKVNAYIYRDVVTALKPQHPEIGVTPVIADSLPYLIDGMYISFKDK